MTAQSQNCMRELLRAVAKGKRMVTLMEMENTHGAISRAEVRAQLDEADARYAQRWGDAFLQEEVALWLATSQLSDAGRKFCELIDDGSPVAALLEAALFEEAGEPIEWTRIGAFQDVTLRQIADSVLPNGHAPTYVQAELVMTEKPLLPTLSEGHFQCYCSPNNPGAWELMQELKDKHDFNVLCTSDVERSLNRGTNTTRSAPLSSCPFIFMCLTKSLHSRPSHSITLCEHMVVYLTGQTWTRADGSELFATEVRRAMGEGVHLLLVHEMPGFGRQVERLGVDFGSFFASPDGATPLDLIKAGIYGQIAIPLKGGAWRDTSMVMLMQTLSAGKADTGLLASSSGPSPLTRSLTRSLSSWRRGSGRLVSPSRAGSRLVSPSRPGSRIAPPKMGGSYKEYTMTKKGSGVVEARSRSGHSGAEDRQKQQKQQKQQSLVSLRRWRRVRQPIECPPSVPPDATVLSQKGPAESPPSTPWDRDDTATPSSPAMQHPAADLNEAPSLHRCESASPFLPSLLPSCDLSTPPRAASLQRSESASPASPIGDQADARQLDHRPSRRRRHEGRDVLTAHAVTVEVELREPLSSLLPLPPALPSQSPMPSCGPSTLQRRLPPLPSPPKLPTPPKLPLPPQPSPRAAAQPTVAMPRSNASSPERPAIPPSPSLAGSHPAARPRFRIAPMPGVKIAAQIAPMPGVCVADVATLSPKRLPSRVPPSALAGTQSPQAHRRALVQGPPTPLRPSPQLPSNTTMPLIGMRGGCGSTSPCCTGGFATQKPESKATATVSAVRVLAL